MARLLLAVALPSVAVALPRISRAAAAAASADATPPDEYVSLLQVDRRLAGDALAGPSSGGTTWPNPADPNARASPLQQLNIALLKMFPHNLPLVNSTIAGIAITPVPYVVQHGGYDILFRALHDFANESTVQMNVWRGLSDQSHTEVGSDLIANYGGPNQGVVYMVEQMQAHPEPYEADCADWLTYKYEVLQCMSGLLQWDVNGTRGAAAVEAGLLEQIVHTMRVEADRRPSMDVACNCMDYLLIRNASYAGQLRDLGAMELAEQAVKTYSSYDPTPFLFGTTYGQQYPVVFTCAHVLKILNATQAG